LRTFGSTALMLHLLLLIAVEATDLERAAASPPPAVVSGFAGARQLESILPTLQKLAPSVARYLMSHGITLTFLLENDYAARYSDGGIAMTEARTKVFVNAKFAADPVMLAAILAHESVHIRHGDIYDEMSHHSFLRHSVWQSEEDEAHAAGDRILLAAGKLKDLIRTENVLLLVRPLHGYAVIFYVVAAAVVILNRRGSRLDARSVCQRTVASLSTGSTQNRDQVVRQHSRS
jgi:hypothetical protein